MVRMIARMNDEPVRAGRASGDERSVRVGRLIEDAQLLRRITQEEAADSLGWSLPTYVRTVKGLRPMSLLELERAAVWLGMTTSELVERTN